MNEVEKIRKRLDFQIIRSRSKKVVVLTGL